MALPFALIIPARPPITFFEQLGGIYHIDVPNPKEIANVTLFLTEQIPPGYAIALYFSIPPYCSMQYLGAVANQKPSDIYSTGFPFKVEFESCPTVKFCIRPQTFEQIAILVPTSDGQKQYAKLVAHNLYNFMMSFNNDKMLLNNNLGQEYLVIPTNVFTKWMNKFDEKYSKDQNFILKTTIE